MKFSRAGLVVWLLLCASIQLMVASGPAARPLLRNTALTLAAIIASSALVFAVWPLVRRKP